MRSPSRKKIVPKPAIKVGVTGILADANGNVLMGLRDKKDASFPGFWCIPGGGVELGETYDEALVREFKEETCLEIVPFPRVLGVHQRIVKGKRVERHTILICKVVHLARPQNEPIAADGFSDLRWVSRDSFRIWQANNLMTPLTVAAMLEYYAKIAIGVLRQDCHS